jgi:hypothetical protein
LDYRIVVEFSWAIYNKNKTDYSFNDYDYPGHLYRDRHDLIADIVAVFSNMGFQTYSEYSKKREWRAGEWQDWYLANTNDILFQVKAYLNGNMHFRIMPDAIKALNIEAARILKWVRTVEDVIVEMDYTVEDAKKYLNSNSHILPSNVKLLGG